MWKISGYFTLSEMALMSYLLFILYRSPPIYVDGIIYSRADLIASTAFYVLAELESCSHYKV